MQQWPSSCRVHQHCNRQAMPGLSQYAGRPSWLACSRKPTLCPLVRMLRLLCQTTLLACVVDIGNRPHRLHLLDASIPALPAFLLAGPDIRAVLLGVPAGSWRGPCLLRLPGRRAALQVGSSGCTLSSTAGCLCVSLLGSGLLRCPNVSGYERCA